MERLLAKMDSNKKEMKADTKTRIDAIISLMDAYQVRMDSYHEEMMAIMKVSLGKTEATIESSQE
jgi:hypothetical protein